MRRALYFIALSLILLGLLGMVPMLRLRRASAGSAKIASLGAPAGTAVTGSSATPAGSPGALAPSLADVSGSPGPSTPHPTQAASERVLGRVGGQLPRRLIRPRLLVEKADRTLTVFSAGKAVKVYRIALGRFADGDKQREGDGRTPLGRFYVCSKNARSNFYKALGLSYPNAEDAKRGVESGLITERQERVILDAIEHHQQPPWGTELGGLIMIHGGGTTRDWTTGCIAMNNADIDELFPSIPIGTEVAVEARAIPAASARTAQVTR